MPDVDAACARFDQLGVEFVKRPQDGSMKGLAFIKDPDGYWIEIVSGPNLRKLLVERGVFDSRAKARAAIGQERILVNCAGTADAVKTVSRDKKTGEIRPCAADRFNRIIQINLVGTFRCIAKSAAGMLTLAPLADGDRGAIVNTASAAARTASPISADGKVFFTNEAGSTLVLDATLANLAEQGIEPEKPPYSIREGGSRLCFVRDPDGYRIELIEKVAGD